MTKLNINPALSPVTPQEFRELADRLYRNNRFMVDLFGQPYGSKPGEAQPNADELMRKAEGEQ